ncbi:hypothetical protein [Henriciella pelagia]|uniref:Lipoprotein n=1 Tax=Henriciella pelagia TaxID=1977912 RepID=A0ABQ1JN58_9PROT|nr:hypothetical protein [Henriciella pelagia]GGB72548.1 hypothetical protein GCM10011503_21500 [Henriciella pelagia]
MLATRSPVPALAAGALLLAACDDEADLTPTLEAGATDIEQDGSLVSEFVSLCGDIVINGAAPASAAGKFDWDKPVTSDMAQMAAMGGYAADKPEGSVTLQVVPLDFPHLQGITCTVSALDPMTVDTSPLDPLKAIDGFSGEVKWIGSSGDRTELGRFSGVASDGAVVTIHAMRFEDGRYMTLSMSKSRPVDPA